MQNNYADVILDITHANVDRPFTYAVPEEMKDTVRPGMPVKLPFGNGDRVRTGYVIALYETAPEVPWELKTILGPAEKQVSAESSLVTLALWMHEHYGCMLSQALKTVMPVKSRVRDIFRRKLMRMKLLQRRLPEMKLLQKPLPEMKLLQRLLPGLKFLRMVLPQTAQKPTIGRAAGICSSSAYLLP